MRRHNPMRVPDSHLPKGLESASASSSKTEAILPLMQKVRPDTRAHFVAYDTRSRWKASMRPSASGRASRCRT